MCTAVMSRLLLCLFTQFLPVYYPSQAEKDNPRLYADNVQQLMARYHVCMHVYTHIHRHTHILVSSCQATKVLISKYLATRRVVVSVGGVNGSEGQLFTSLIHAP